MNKPLGRRLLKIVAWLVAVLAAAVTVLFLLLRHSLPTGGASGPDADALAHAIERSVATASWESTGAVRWSFRDKFHHLWDRRRNFDRVRWGQNEVLLDVGRKDGVARRDGQPVTDPAERQRLVDKAYRAWTNDSFWLNPIPKFFDDGVTREKVDVDGRAALLIHYGKGGLTPGDRYLWLLDDQQRPRAWRLWVSVIPVPGLEIPWQGWTTLATGAVIATQHGVGGPPIGELAGAATLDGLEPGADPFEALTK